jgi:hypothetical protein
VLEIGQALRMLNPDLKLIIFPVRGLLPHWMSSAPGCFPPSPTFYRMC